MCMQSNNDSNINITVLVTVICSIVCLLILLEEAMESTPEQSLANLLWQKYDFDGKRLRNSFSKIIFNKCQTL